jgi:hypothetical protein
MSTISWIGEHIVPLSFLTIYVVGVIAAIVWVEMGLD